MARERFDSGQGRPFGLEYDLDAPAQFGGSSGRFKNVDTGSGTSQKQLVTNPEIENVNRYRQMGEDMSNRGAYQLDWREADQDRADASQARGLQYDSNKILRDQALGNDKLSYNHGQDLLNKGVQAQRAGALSTRGGALSQASALQDRNMGEGAFRQKGETALQAQRADDMAAGRAGWMAGATAQRKGDQTGQYLADQQSEQQAKSELAQRELNSQGQRGMEQMGLDTRRVALGQRQASQGIALAKEQARSAAAEADRNRAVGIMNDAVGSIPVVGGVAKAGMQAVETADGNPYSDHRAKNLQPNALTALTKAKPSGYEDVQIRPLGTADDSTIVWDKDGRHSRQVVPGENQVQEGGASLSGSTRKGGKVGDQVNRADIERMRGEIIAKRKEANAARQAPARKRPLTDLLKEAQSMIESQKSHTAASLGQGPAVKDRDTGPVEKGNIDHMGRPEVNNGDGSTSTVRSISFNDGPGREVLIPTAYDGAIHSDDDSIKNYRKTGQHMGVFKTPEDATAHAKQVHMDYQDGKYHAPRRSDVDTIKYGASGGEPDRDDVDNIRFADVPLIGADPSKGISGAPKGYAASRAGKQGDMFGGGPPDSPTTGWDAEHGMAPGTRDVLKYGTPSIRSEKGLDDYSKAVMVSGVEAKIPQTLSDERTKKSETPEEKKAREDREDAEETAKFMGDSKGPTYKAPSGYEERSKAIDEKAAQDKQLAAEEKKRQQKPALDYVNAQDESNRRTAEGLKNVPLVGKYVRGRAEASIAQSDDEKVARGVEWKQRENAIQRVRNTVDSAARKLVPDSLLKKADEAPVSIGYRPKKDMTSDERSKSKGNALSELQQDANRKLAGETYTYKEGFGEDTDQLHHGFMAQNLEKNPITATAVREDESGLKKVDMQDAVRVTAAGVAENQEQIDELEAALAKLKARRKRSA